MPPLEPPSPTSAAALRLAMTRAFARRRWAALLGLTALASLLSWWAERPPPQQQPSASAPPASVLPLRVGPSAGYVGSAACRGCHASEYESWHESYHRTMTEPALGQALRAPWRGALEWRGRAYTLFLRDDEPWVELPDPAQAQAGELETAPSLERRVVMTTGSHHYQAYWVRGERGNELLQFPFVYHFESRRFLPRHDVFLQPEQDPPHVARWNSNCIQCHSVAGEPRHEEDTDQFATRAAELGIACEACHGPGAEHVAHQRDGGARTGDLRIVHPGRLGAERASEICGQCHSYFLPRDPEAWWRSGFVHAYRPGDDLDASRRLLEFGPDVAPFDPELSASLISLFYPDGTIRVGGREWNGLRRSACFSEGTGERQLSCLSCHRLHGGTRDDQLGPAGDGNGACQGCHTKHGAGHTRHADGSSGGQCVACHMPRTTYALLKSIRSHRITRPVVDATPGASLNACNLCHQDRSLAWTAERLDEWFPAQTAAAPLASADGARPASKEQPAESALALALLRGDAASRVIAAAELGAPEARAVSGSGWQPQLLVEALDDPYAAVRFVAARSLRSFPGFADVAFDFVAPRERRLSQQADARARLSGLLVVSPGGPPPLPLGSDGRLHPDVIERLASERDERPIRIAE